MATLSEYYQTHPDARPRGRRSRPEHALQTKLGGFCREWCAVPHLFAAHDRTQKASAAQHILEARRHILAGWPDVELCLPDGRTFRCELKAPGNKPTDRQGEMAARLNRLGHPTAWADSVGGFLAAAIAAGVPFRAGAEMRAAVLDALLTTTAALTRTPGKAAKPRARKSDASLARTEQIEAIRKKVMF